MYYISRYILFKRYSKRKQKSNYKHIENDGFEYKRKRIKVEQAQILETGPCQRAFKENYHIKPLDWGENQRKSLQKKALAKEKDMRGGIVCEKSYKILLCDMVTGLVAVILLASAVNKIKTR